MNIRGNSSAAARHGYALLFSIMAIAIMSIVGGIYLKRADAFKELKGLERQKTFQNLELLSQAQKVRKKLTDQLEPYLISSPTTETTSTDFQNWLNSNVVNIYNAANSTQGLRIELECISQESTISGGSEREACTRNRARSPKTFRLVVSKQHPETKVLSRVVEEFKIDRPSATQFAYVITNATSDLTFGKVSFEGPVGLYFDYGSMSKVTKGLIFDSNEFPGTVFNGTVFTSLPSPLWFYAPDGKFFSMRNVAYSASGAKYMQQVSNSFTTLKSANGTYNKMDLTTEASEKFTEALNYCKANHVVNPSLCTATHLSSAYVLNGCNISVYENVQWDYPTANPNDHGTNFDGTAGGPSNVVYSGAQVDGQIFYLPGTAFVREGTAVAPGKKSTLCASMTLMADAMILQNSLVRQDNLDPSKNIGLFTGGASSYTPLFGEIVQSPSISLSPYDSDGPSLTAVRGAATVLDDASGSSGKSVYDLKRAGTNISSTRVSFTVEATMVPGQASLTVPPVYYSHCLHPSGTNDEAAIDLTKYPCSGPVELGVLKLSGLLITAEPLATSAVHTIDGVKHRGGFSNVVMDQGSVSEHPPPGMDIAVDTGLVLTVLNIAVSNISMRDAILDIKGE